MLNINDKAIDFKLKGTDNKEYSLNSFKDKNIFIIIFTCNHCPYAQAYEERIKQLQTMYNERGVQIIAINSNDDKQYGEDSFENMKIRAKKRDFNFPYLRDKSQEIARAYGAEVTPDVFVFDNKRVLRYRGRIDDNWENSEEVKKHNVREAVGSLLRGEEVKVKEAKAIGCSIKWKS